MTMWHKAVGVFLLILVIAALKADYSTRMYCAVALIGGLAYIGLSKKK